jgi:DNA-binding MarR family transcriptional regulator
VTSEREQEIARAVRELVAAGREVHTAMARRLGVGPADLAALDHLVSAPDELGPVGLGHVLGMTSASATVLVDRLAAAGHVRRDRHPQDGRRVTLEVTDSARAEVRDVLRPLLDALAEVSAGLTAEQAETVLAFLTGTTAALHGYAATPAGPAA